MAKEGEDKDGSGRPDALLQHPGVALNQTVQRLRPLKAPAWTNKT